MIHNEYLISENDEGLVWIEDYYSCMTAIFQKWQEKKWQGGTTFFQMMLHDYVHDFDLLDWMVSKEPVTEWQKLALDAKELRWHLARLEFAEMFAHVRGNVNELLQSTFREICDADAHSQLWLRTDADKYEEYRKSKPSDTDEWKDAYVKAWRDCGFDMTKMKAAWTEPMSASDVQMESNKLTHDLFGVAMHVQYMILSSCKRVSEKAHTTLLGIEDWQTLMRNAFIDYVERNDRTIERNLIKLANKHKTPTEERTPEVWAKVYEEELARLNDEFECIRKYSKTLSKPSVKTWVLDKLDDELFLPAVKDTVERLLTDFGEEVRKGSHTGLYHQSFIHTLEDLFEEVHRMNLIKCGVHPALREQYDAWIRGEMKDDCMWRDLREKMLSNIFYTDCIEELDDFVAFLRKHPKPTEITEQVRRLTQDKAISDRAYKKDLHTLLHDAGIYAPGYESWRQQVTL